jgi:ABC-2 type transport system permease protein
MNRSLVLARRELRAAFTTPLLFLVGMPLLALSGWYFYSVLVGDRTSELRRYFTQLEFLLLLTVPLFTMRTIAEERRSGSLDLLLVRPISEGAVVLAKAASVVVSILTMLAFPFAVFLVALARLGEPDTGALVTQSLGAVLVLILVTCIGVAWSSMTPSQILAAAGALGTNIVLWLGSGLSESQLRLLSIKWHIDAANTGLISVSDLAFFFVWSGALLALARLGLLARRR